MSPKPTDKPFGAFLKPPPKALRNLRRNPLPDHPSGSATCPGSQPENHLSESLLRHTFETDPSVLPSEMPRVPKVKPKDPFEICLMSPKPCREPPFEAS